MMQDAIISFQGVTVAQFLELMDERNRAIIKEELCKLREAESDKLISINEVVELFNNSISKQTVRNWTTEGYLQSKQIGRRVFYSKRDVLAAAKTLKKYTRVNVN